MLVVSEAEFDLKFQYLRKLFDKSLEFSYVLPET